MTFEISLLKWRFAFFHSEFTNLVLFLYCRWCWWDSDAGCPSDTIHSSARVSLSHHHGSQQQPHHRYPGLDSGTSRSLLRTRHATPKWSAYLWYPWTTYSGEKSVSYRWGNILKTISQLKLQNVSTDFWTIIITASKPSDIYIWKYIYRGSGDTTCTTLIGSFFLMEGFLWNFQTCYLIRSFPVKTANKFNSSLFIVSSWFSWLKLVVYRKIIVDRKLKSFPSLCLSVMLMSAGHMLVYS